MLARILAACGYARSGDIVDFVMTGVLVTPMVVLLGCGFDDAFGVLLVMLAATVALMPRLHALGEAQRREEEAQAKAQAAYLRQVTGKDR